MGYQHLEVDRAGHVSTLWLNRPEKHNAMSTDMWEDIPTAMAELDSDDSVRVVVLAGRGPSFTVGIDLGLLGSMQPRSDSRAAASMDLHRVIARMQKTASCFSESPKPVIAAIHGYCLGAGMDLITACDIRLGARDAVFSVRETRMGLVADIGTLQRLPSIVGAGATAELAFTGKDIDIDHAHRIGLVNTVASDQESLMVTTYALAEEIASNSPLVTHGIKRVLAANDGRTIEQRLDFVAQWNASHLFSNDLAEAMAAHLEKRDPEYKGD